MGLTFYASILVYSVLAHWSWQSNCRLVIPMKKGNIFPQFGTTESGRLFRPANDQRKHFASLNGIVTILVCDDDVIPRVFVDDDRTLFMWGGSVYYLPLINKIPR